MDISELYRELNKGAISGAKALLGWELICESDQGITSGYIVETEAYLQHDPASHSHKGMSSRNAEMFKAAGTIYVYFIYGMHNCVNIVTGEEGVGEAVLIRALEPRRGIETMMARRGNEQVNQLTNGPAKLVQALGISLRDNGTVLGRGSLRLEPGLEVSPTQIVPARRIGISKATEELQRFYISGNSFISR